MSFQIPTCPSCGGVLASTPTRQTKCKLCGAGIFVKSTPDNPQKRLMTQAQAESAERAWSAKNKVPTPKAIFRSHLSSTRKQLAKFKAEGFRSVQIFGKGKLCAICALSIGRVVPVSTPAEQILDADCLNLADGGYHCSPMVSAAIKDRDGNVRFDQ